MGRLDLVPSSPRLLVSKLTNPPLTPPALQAAFAWCTVCFGLAYSNLSYRTVVTTGPYYFLRHPAYVVKVHYLAPCIAPI